MSFSLENFERLCYSRQRELATRALVELLQSLDSQYGFAGDGFNAQPLRSLAQPEVDAHIWTRAAAAISCLMADPELQFAPEWQSALLGLHRWFGALFSATPMRNADHVMRVLNISDKPTELSTLALSSRDLLKFSLLYTPESEAPLAIDAMWEADPVLTVSLCLVLVSPRFLAAPEAHAKRELILPWLTRKLMEIEDVERLPIGILHDVYMHCSYADRSDRHDIKRSINHLLRKKMLQAGIEDRLVASPSVLGTGGQGKPVMLVVLEWFTGSHSIYRTHSRTLEAARERFTVVGLGYEGNTDALTRQVFDEFVALPAHISMLDQIRFIQQEAVKRDAQVCYMPSVGMFPLTMWLANVRVAPLQMMALGHPATSHSQQIDYVVVEEDYVGDASCFSERLLQLPSDGMPYRPSVAAEGIEVVRNPDVAPQVVRIAMCATTMKLNPTFLAACARIATTVRVRVHFEFLIGQNQGLVRPALERVVRQFLGDAVTVHGHLDYVRYMDVIAGCDMFINPFPFGNTNGIIDTVSAGLVGVCKTGPEVFEHIDQGLFARLGFPAWLVASSVEAYVQAAVRLAENHEERLALRARCAGKAKVQTLFEGRPQVMGELILEKLTALAEGKKAPAGDLATAGIDNTVAPHEILPATEAPRAVAAESSSEALIEDAS